MPRRFRWVRSEIGVALVLAVAASAAGCGSNDFLPPPPPELCWA